MNQHHDFRSRPIDFASLDTPTRRVIALGFALLLGLAALAAVRDYFPGPQIFAVTYVVPLAALIVAGLAVAAGIALMLAGVSIARSWWRFTGLVGLAGLSFVLVASVQAGSYAALALSGATLLGVSGTLLIAFGHRLGAWHRIVAASAIVVTAVVAIVVAAILIYESNYAATVVVALLGFLVIAASPAIIVAGWDIAEIASEIGSSTLRVLTAVAGGETVASIAFIPTGIALALWLSAAHGLAASSVFLRSAGFAGLCLLFIWALPRLREGARYVIAGVGYFNVLFVAVIVSLTFMASPLTTRDVEGTYNVRTGHEFSVALPRGWRVVNDPARNTPRIAETRKGITNVVFAPNGVYGVPRMTIDARPVSPETTSAPKSIDVVVGAGERITVPLAFSVLKGRVQSGTSQFGDRAGGRYTLDYARLVVDDAGPAGNGAWSMYCVFEQPDTRGILTACRSIGDSIRGDARIEPDPAWDFLLNQALWLALGLGCLGVIVARPAGTTAIEFIVWTSIVFVMRNAGAAQEHFHEAIAYETTLSAEILACALWLISVAAFVAGVESSRNPSSARLARARSATLSCLAALVIATVFFELYVWAAKGSGHSNAIRGAIICVALSWEFWMSGVMNADRESARFPRPARITLYLGYLLTLATIVFFFVRLPRVNGADQAPFESEVLVAAGIASVGLAFLIYRHVRFFLDASHATGVASDPRLPHRSC